MDSAFWQTYYRHTPDGMLLVDADGIVADCNDGFLQLSGADRGSVLGFPWTGVMSSAVTIDDPCPGAAAERCRGLGTLAQTGTQVAFTVTQVADRRGRSRGGVVCVHPLLPGFAGDSALQRKLGELETTQVIMVNALARLAERRDPDIGDHLERVRLYTFAVASHLIGRPGLEQIEDVVQLSRVAVLHDLGKIGVPEQILFKPAPLSDVEFAVVKRHPLYGAEFMEQTEGELKRLLAVQQSFLTMAREIALYHHERYDGAGYPYGLSAEQIPLAARVVALADVYDALTSQRVYKPCWTHDQAKELICQQSGRQFDPLVVEAFLDSQREFEVIRTTLSAA